ncbi:MULTISPECIES: hypothetical protein [unclassified Bacillus cereus group]|uniref:hypothetical protein n=1 Tax=unclassified Bacillus cereus group TaxID=2750818 RepID=UPI001F55ADA5|nr:MULTISPECIES: hypothetical protein [unclassified Bacillus cereus group]
MAYVIDQHFKEHNEIYYACMCLLSVLTFRKIVTIEQKKKNFKNAMTHDLKDINKDNIYKL